MLVTAFCGGPLAENCYLAKDEATGQCVLVDPGFSSLALDKAVKEADVRYILLTHSHFDHAGAAEHYRIMTGASLVCAHAEAALLQEPKLNLSAWFDPSAPLILQADKTVGEGDGISLGETTLTVLETPGHTAGGCCYFTPGCLFAGDTLMAGSMGRTDFPTGNNRQMAQSLARLKELPEETAVYSGHGDVSTIGEEKRNNLYLRSL